MKLETPLIDKLREQGLRLTVPIIVMRSGGLDGVAMQVEEYSAMLAECLDVDVHIITGRDERSEPVPRGPAKVSIVPRLDFHHPDSETLFANEFAIGPETAAADRISDEEWIELFKRHKNSLKEELNGMIAAAKHNAPVIIFNLLSLRHAQPAAAVALREIIGEYSDRAFLSHAADPDAERPEKIARLRPFVLKWISANGFDEKYSGGPYRMDNLYHIVLNPKQRENFLYKYMVDSDHVFEMPDFLEFDNDSPVIPNAPDEGFLDYLASKCVFADEDGYEYSTVPIPDDAVVFLSPVRPVYRKRIREAMLVAYQYGNTRNKPVVFVVTHPDSDDKEYFLETVRFANAMGVQYVYLGEDFTPEKLDYAYRNFAALNTVGVVASAAGGWENALNEMAATCIPFFMSVSLNSFKTLTEEMDIDAYGMDFSGISSLLETGLADQLSGVDLSGIAYMDNLLEWIDEVLDPETRRKIIVHNFNQAYKYLSQEAAARRLVENVQKIHSRHKSLVD